MKQRSDLTYKQNLQHGRHGWLRLTPAYSVRLVDQILDEFGAKAERVFEPFSGTGTTPLCASYRGLSAVATDINPFLIWLAQAKSASYSEAHCAELRAAASKVIERLRRSRRRTLDLPPLKNIERWWNVAELTFVAGLRTEIEEASPGPVFDLLRVAFCRTMMSLSNAAFNHQSMSFKDSAAPRKNGQAAFVFDAIRPEFVEQWMSDVEVVATSALDNPEGRTELIHTDARLLSSDRLEAHSFDLLITSPPYPNRMSYVRELRPYMYWLRFLSEAQQAGELDWDAIGGTWGIATSRLSSWKPSGAFVPDYLGPILDAIRATPEKNSALMAQYVHKYFEDMQSHFESAARLVKKRGTAHYIIGNSTFYGHVVPAERIYADQLQNAGFRKTEIRAIRKRNSKKELVEFHVIAHR